MKNIISEIENASTQKHFEPLIIISSSHWLAGAENLLVTVITSADRIHRRWQEMSVLPLFTSV